MSPRALLGLTLALVLPLAGCAPSHDETAAPPSPGLTAFGSCAEMTAALRTAAKAAVGPHGLQTPQEQGAVPPPFASAGPDRPDIVKSDGRRIVTLTGGTLRVIDASTKRVTGSMSGGLGRNVGLLISGDRALVLSQGPFPRSSPPKYTPPPQAGIGTELLLVDISGDPRILSRYRTSASLVEARQTGDTTRIVLNYQARIRFPVLPGARDEALMAANLKAIDAAGADAWLPDWQTITTEGNREVFERGKVPCEAVSRPSTYSGRSVLSALTIPLSSASRLDGGRPVAVVAEGDASITPTGPYLTNVEYTPEGAVGATQIYRFDARGAEPPVARAGGAVPGTLMDPDQLSDWDGHLRLAIVDQRTRRLTVRVLRADDLRPVGEVDGIGAVRAGAAVRFIGPRGYVRAAQQTDALHVVDLADPSSPRVTGTLPVPGSGTSLQEVGRDRLIGVSGSELRVSLFDVSDPAAPRQLAQHRVPGGASVAADDSRAILWHASSQLLVLPVSRQADTALALRVTGDVLTVIRELDTPRVVRALVIGDELWTISDRDLRAFRLSTLEPAATVTF